MTTNDPRRAAGARLLRLEGTLSAGGLTGPYEQLVCLDDGRFVTRYTLGPARIERGYDGRVAWVRHPTGEVVAQDGEAARRQAVTEAFLHACGWNEPARWAATLSPAGAPAQDGVSARVLQATPGGGLPVVLGFDAAGDRLVRVSMEVNGLRHERRLDDARDAAGAIRPHRLATGTGDPARDVVVRVDRYVALDAGEAGDDPFAMPAARVDDLRFAPGCTSVRLPARAVNGHLLVTARVDGHEMSLLVDSGAVHVLDREAAARAGLRIEGALEARGPGEAAVSTGLARASRLQLGEALAIDAPIFRVLSLDELSAVEGVRIDGLLGMELFQRLVVTMDHEAGEVQLRDPRAFVPPPGAVSLPLVFHAHLPAVAATLDGVPGEFWLDTGNRNALTLWAPFAQAHGFADRAAPEPEEIIGWGLGGRVPGRVMRGGVLQLGPWSLAGPLLTLPSAREGVTATRHVAGNLGAEVLRRFVATLDYPRRQVHLQAGPSLHAPFEADGAGLWLVREGEGARVEGVRADSPAAQAGVQPGDLMLALDDEPVGTLGLDALRARLREGGAGRRCTLSLQPAGVAPGTRCERVLVLARRTPALSRAPGG